MILRNYVTTESKVVQIQACASNIDDQEIGKTKFTVSLCSDNSAFIMDTGPNKQPQRNEIQKTTLYPPPSAQLIEKIVYSMRLDRYLVLLSNSSLCIYKAVKETALLERI